MKRGGLLSVALGVADGVGRDGLRGVVHVLVVLAHDGESALAARLDTDGLSPMSEYVARR
jgi:hypothetical protein